MNEFGADGTAGIFSVGSTSLMQEDKMKFT